MENNKYYIPTIEELFEYVLTMKELPVYDNGVILLIIGMFKSEGTLDLTGLFSFVLLIVFILIFGGIFWW